MGGGNVDSAGRVSSGDRSDGGASLGSDRGGGSASGRSSRNSTLRSSSGPRESVALVSTSAHDSSDVATVYECTGLATSNVSSINNNPHTFYNYYKLTITRYFKHVAYTVPTIEIFL